MAALLLLDSNLLIDHLRGRSAATTCLAALPPRPLISAITVTELFAGARDEAERQRIDALIAACEVVPVTSELARQAGLLRQAHGMSVPDALIAATALLREATLLTFNTRHFPMLERVRAPYPNEMR